MCWLPWKVRYWGRPLQQPCLHLCKTVNCFKTAYTHILTNKQTGLHFKIYRTCKIQGPNCQCGDSCTCAGCPKPSSSALTITIEASHLAYVAIGVAIFAAGWMAAKRFGKDK